MRESFLHFIWQFQKFDNISIQTADGQSVQIFAIGQYNTDAGPDFLNAKLLIGDITWYGHVEIHLKSSDWNKHQHQHDRAYNNVVLHVVWEHDEEVQLKNGQTLPVIELKHRINPTLLKKCNELIKSPDVIACASQFHEVRPIDRISMLDLIGIHRLKEKSAFILRLLEENDGSWEDTTYQVLAKNFGFKTNDEAFLKMARKLDHKILIKHADHLNHIESIVFGMAGFLEEELDEYQMALKKDFEFFSKKYSLTEQKLISAEWKFLRLRPSNFPTVRLAQFSAFLSKNVKCFHQFIHFENLNEIKKLFDFEPSTYWRNHYDFNKKSKRTLNAIGNLSKDLILINTVAPLLAAYAKYTDDYRFIDKAVDLLQSIKAEKNHISRMWENLGLRANNAFESQAMIGLRNDFCLKKRCLSCKIGVSLINS